jgi:hypothetical protein
MLGQVVIVYGKESHSKCSYYNVDSHCQPFKKKVVIILSEFNKVTLLTNMKPKY